MTFRLGDFEPMLASRADAPFDDPRFVFEPKVDGVRALAYADESGVARLQSRGGIDVTRRYAVVARAVAESLRGAAAVLDGEVCATGAEAAPNLSAVLRSEHAARASFHAFDVLAVGDEPVVANSLEARRAALEDLLARPAPAVRVVERLPLPGTEAFEAAVRDGLEGVVAKRRGSPYAPGRRSRDWVKVRRADAASLVVGAWLPGKGDLEGTVGSLVLGAFDEAGRLRHAGSAGSGLTRRERDALRDALHTLAAPESPFADALPPGARPVRPVLVFEVEFMEVTRDGRLRAPVLRGLRPDRSPRECRLESELPTHPAVKARR